MGTSPLHTLRRRLEGLAFLIEADRWETVVALADEPPQVEALARLFEATDRYLTDKVIPFPQYLPRVKALLEGERWHWHLADGGYSRVSVTLVEGPSQVLRLDRGLSRALPQARWDAAHGGIA